MSLHLILQTLQHNPLAAAVRGESDPIQITTWFFPIIETLHVLSIAVVFGSIFMVDIRLLGLTERDGTVSQISREILPYTWTAFGCAALTGSLLFLSKAEQYFHNLQFELKFLFMFLAGVNMLIFHRGVYRHVLDWEQATRPPLGARVAGGLSIALWIAVIFMGRWIGFTTNV
ncbi:MAG TPA: DUF6644 family protein [Steroidobacteraceae bacterium]|jgi:hypothetical protein|nr:DUF6644 family protein [Steroidobacteraceae bacterium]